MKQIQLHRPVPQEERTTHVPTLFVPIMELLSAEEVASLYDLYVALGGTR